MKTQIQYEYELKTKNPDVTLLSEYKGSQKKVKVKCCICGNIWEPTASHLLTGQSHCPKCHGRLDYSNPNCFHNKHPQWAKCLQNELDGYLYTGGSGVATNWICPNCKNVVKGVPIKKVVQRNRIPCKRCSDGISYPNKYMFNMLEQLGVDFITEYSPTWISPKRYDFYIQKKDLIIEMDGLLGHGNKSWGDYTAKESAEIDTYKDKKAAENGIKVIRIDCKRSDSDYISKNIMESELVNYFNLHSIDWDLCNTSAYSSMKIKACDLWKEMRNVSEIMKRTHLTRTTVTRYLKDATKYGLCDYDPKIEHTKSGQNNIKCAYEKNKKSVVCLDTGRIFSSYTEAYRWLGYNPDGHSIQDNCRGITKSAGKLPGTNQKLHWRFV